ncbi:MAG: nidogen-like domain-containing protein [Limisphaerales bacterium]
MEHGLNIIAPFWGDVDTRNQCSALVTYGTNTVDGHAAFGVNWAYVGYYPAQVDKLNAFQLILIDRSDIATNDFDVEFNYNQIQWESGAASYGPNGLGGDAARVGYASPNDSGFEFNCSDIDCPNVTGVLLDSSPTTGLIYHDFNSTVPGRYVFQFRSGSPLGHP